MIKSRVRFGLWLCSAISWNLIFLNSNWFGFQRVTFQCMHESPSGCSTNELDCGQTPAFVVRLPLIWVIYFTWVFYLPANFTTYRAKFPFRAMLQFFLMNWTVVMLTGTFQLMWVMEFTGGFYLPTVILLIKQRTPSRLTNELYCGQTPVSVVRLPLIWVTCYLSFFMQFYS